MFGSHSASHESASVPAFPFLNAEQFASICRHFITQLKPDGKWDSVRLVDLDPNAVYLVITTVLPKSGSTVRHSPTCSSTGTLDEAGEDEEDDEIILPELTTRASVEYHIVRSPVYQVPVLYLLLRNASEGNRSLVDFVYDNLVPEAYKDQLSGVGAMGAVSYAEHPVLNSPAIFIHPCNTADALRELSMEIEMTLENYILLWLGIVGGCVSLTAPLGP